MVIRIVSLVGDELQCQYDDTCDYWIPSMPCRDDGYKHKWTCKFSGCI